MNHKINSIIKEAGVTTALLGGAVASCTFGSPLVATILGGVLTNILSNKIEQSDLLNIRDILSGRDPGDLNHDLEKLILEAMEWATRNICFSYQAYCNTDFQRRALNQVELQIINQIKKIDKSQWNASNDLLNQIDQISSETDLMKGLIVDNSEWSPVNSDFPFPAFYEDQFIENFKLCFGELLKDPNHRSALVAYNRTIANQMQKRLILQEDKIDKLIAGNDEIKQELARIAHGPANQFVYEYVSPAMDIALDDYLKPLHDDVKLLVDMNGHVLAGIEYLKKESSHQTQKIEGLRKSVEKSNKSNSIFIVVIPVLVVGLTYLIYQYRMAKQPFTFTVNIKDGSQNQSLPYENSTVTIDVNGNRESKESHNGTAIFAGLPSSARKESIEVEIQQPGYYFMDTTITGMDNFNVVLTRDDSYRWMKGRVKDATTGIGVQGAKVTVKDIVAYTDGDGSYSLDIPEPLQSTEQRLIVTKEGYEPWERIEPVIQNSESIIHLHTLSK